MLADTIWCDVQHLLLLVNTNYDVMSYVPAPAIGNLQSSQS